MRFNTLFFLLVSSAYCKSDLLLSPEQDEDVTCGINEEFAECGKERRCDNLSLLPERPTDCQKGCFCKIGYYRNTKGKCVKNCERRPIFCAINEIYSECIDEKRCNDDSFSHDIPKYCHSGCQCADGYARDRNRKCIPLHKCEGYANETSCQVNEEFSNCGTHCEETCDDKPKACILLCKVGCFCKPGYVRAYNGGQCIPALKCRRESEECPSNEEYQTCGGCQKTCDDLDPHGPKKACTWNCNVGCFCKPGYIREHEAGKCIPVSSCPKKKLSANCSRNEVFSTCGTACEDSCWDHHKRRSNRLCPHICKIGCFCRPGYLRRYKGGKCIPVSRCTRKPHFTEYRIQKERCPANEEYNSCKRTCVRTCDDIGTNRPCSLDCDPGCHCKPGYVREHEGGKCILMSSCPSKPESCSANEEYQKCGRCELTCDDLGLDPPFRPCPLVMCIPGCKCKPGYIRDHDGGKCIPKSSCPNKLQMPGQFYLKHLIPMD